jgi:serine protease DegQ
MKRVAVYASARPSREAPEAKEENASAPPAEPKGAFSWRGYGRRHRRGLIATGATLALLLLAAAAWVAGPWQGGMTQADVEATVQRALVAAARPSAADAFERIAPSIVHVRAYAEEEVPEEAKDKPAGQEKQPTQPKQPAQEQQQAQAKPTKPEAKAESPDNLAGNVGTGVVIVDTGVILTNLHVVRGAKRIRITFADGLEADAEVIGERPEHDLAVLQAKTIPDDLMSAVMRSTNGLKPGDEVVAVGFPFGIGPSASAGVISGLKREYRSTSGERILTNLVQFDAAVNPGNSGGALVTLEGEVVGIVTGLLNPTEQRVFIGIGFAVPIENAAAAAGLSPF